MAIRITMTDGRTITGKIASIEEIADGELRVGDIVRVTEAEWDFGPQAGDIRTLVAIDTADPKFAVRGDGGGRSWVRGVEKV